MLGNQHQQPVRVLLQWRDASATRLRCRAAVIMPAPEPVDHRTRAHFKKHGHLVSRGATLDDRYRARPQVVRIRLGHPTILPKGIRGTRLAHPQTFGNPPDSRPLGYALDAVVGLTAEDLPLYEKISGSASVIPNYVLAIEAAPIDAREKILLFVGHLDARKGIDRLLWGLKQALVDHPDWKLVVVGGGEKGHTDWGYLDYVSTLIQLLGLVGRVEFHPATSRIDEWYRRASIYVLGSRREGLP